VDTWRSLVVKHGLAWDEAVEIGVGLLVAASHGGAPRGDAVWP